MDIEKQLQATFPEAVIHIGEKLTNEEWLSLGSPMPFVIIRETKDIIALHSFSMADLVLVDKITGIVSVGKNTVELGTFLFSYQYGLHFLYSMVEYDKKAETVKEPALPSEPVAKVVKKPRRKKVVKDVACKEALTILFPDFEIETDSNNVPFIIAEGSLCDLTEHFVEMGCLEQDGDHDQYLFSNEKQLFQVHYGQTVEPFYKVWLSVAK